MNAAGLLCLVPVVLLLLAYVALFTWMSRRVP